MNHQILSSGVRLAFSMVSLACLSSVRASPPVIDDLKIMNTLRTATADFVEKEGIPTADSLGDKARKSNTIQLDLALPLLSEGDYKPDYQNLSRSVYVMNTVFKCGKCNDWHQGSTSTAWCIGADGLMVTNAHVFISAKGGAMAVSDPDGQCYPVVDLLGMDKALDIAVFRVKATGLKPLRLGAIAEVGSPVTSISNPQQHCFLRTSGSVSRYALGTMAPKLKRVTWMNVTADYAVGSSGGPVFNDAGEVVGMISSTQSIYTGPSKRAKDSPKGDFQMTIKLCVPVDSIRAMFQSESKNPE
jgi:serine protease Do